MADRLVYSTDAGRVTTCSVCGQLYEQCRCDQPAPPLVQKNDGIVRVMRDRKHRGGKTVTVVTACSMRSSLNGPVAQATTKRLSRSWTRHPQRSPLSGWQAAPFFLYKRPELIDFDLAQVQIECHYPNFAAIK